MLTVDERLELVKHTIILLRQHNKISEIHVPDWRGNETLLGVAFYDKTLAAMLPARYGQNHGKFAGFTIEFRDEIFTKENIPLDVDLHIDRSFPLDAKIYCRLGALILSN